MLRGTIHIRLCGRFREKHRFREVVRRHMTLLELYNVKYSIYP